MIDIADEKRKILDGTYPSRIIAGRQNKHIEGTREFEQSTEKMERDNPGSKPAIIDADAQLLMDKYKGTGQINIPKGSQYPIEIIDTGNIIGKTWVNSLNKYYDTKRIKIVYSSTGVHIIPINDYERR